MSTVTSVAEWPNVRDVAKQLDVSAVYVNCLIHKGRIEVVRTRLGFLVNPASAAAFQAGRDKRRHKGEQAPLC